MIMDIIEISMWAEKIKEYMSDLRMVTFEN